MRRERFLAPGHAAGDRSGIYHCVSRVVDRRMVFGREEKEWFVKLMRMYERFCGVRVLAFCVMSNHFHVLVEVPLQPTEGISDDEFFERLNAIYSAGEVDEVRTWVMQRRAVGDEAGAEELRERWLYRMWDLSEFMKSLKQRFTQWFNKKHERTGTLWEDTFRSVVVEDGYALRIMAAYIDLNPVRAGIAKRPEDYRWCGYAEALAGRRKAREGIERLMAKYEDFFEEDGSERAETVPKIWRQVIADYRVILFTDGVEILEESGRPLRQGIAGREAEQVKKQGGLLGQAAMLRHRLRHFSEGMAIGSRGFLEDVFSASRDRFGSSRNSGPRPLRGYNTSLHALRDLRQR